MQLSYLQFKQPNILCTSHELSRLNVFLKSDVFISEGFGVIDSRKKSTAKVHKNVGVRCLYSIFKIYMYMNDVNIIFCLLGNMKEYREALLSNSELQSDIKELRGRVEVFARTFTMPGFDNH